MFSITDWPNPRPLVESQEAPRRKPPPDPDPVLPAKVISIQWGNPGPAADGHLHARRAAHPERVARC